MLVTLFLQHFLQHSLDLSKYNLLNFCFESNKVYCSWYRWFSFVNYQHVCCCRFMRCEDSKMWEVKDVCWGDDVGF